MGNIFAHLVFAVVGGKRFEIKWFPYSIIDYYHVIVNTSDFRSRASEPGLQIPWSSN